MSVRNRKHTGNVSIINNTNIKMYNFILISKTYLGEQISTILRLGRIGSQTGCKFEAVCNVQYAIDLETEKN
jgi:hypothetical protein